MCDQFRTEIRKLHIFAKWKACDLTEIFASQLSLIWNSHVCAALAEYSGSCSNVFYWAYFCFLQDIILKEDENNIKCMENSSVIPGSVNQFWKFYPFIAKIL